jgi:tRNA nucleotidyltransferase (CCA-adding enzyme)
MKNILEAIVVAGGKPLFVGGCVRDKILRRESKDIDVEVYDLPADQLVKVLSKFGRVDQVGVSFGVIKLTTDTDDFDFTLPRLDNKVGVGHTGFEVVVDHTLSPMEAAKRRDFTINSIAEDMDGNLIDPYGGESDLMYGVLRATSEHFAEDPLRVLRGFQFAGRFNMKADTRTSDLCRSLLPEAETLASERIFGEWEKWALKSVKPSAGLEFLLDTGWIKLYPELDQLVGLEQDAEWHPEGCVFTHTGLVCDAAAEIAVRDQLDDEDRLVLMFAALCHDLGKATTTSVNDQGRIIAPGHAAAGLDPTITLMQRIGFVGDNKLRRILDQVVPLVVEHMAHINVVPTDRVVNRLAVRTHPSSLKQLVRLMEADHSGRHPLPKHCPPVALQMLEIADRLAIQDEKPANILGGRHLIDLGVTSGPIFSTIIALAYQEQLDGRINTLDEAISFAREYLNS